MSAAINSSWSPRGDFTMSYRDRLESLWQSAEVSEAQVKSRKAKISFVLGLSSFLVSFLAGVPAVINGLVGLKEIRQSGGQIQGRGLAIWGIALGLVGSSASGLLLLYGAAQVYRASQTISTL
jgi:Domain of unknown function (DUF4190)